jgi:hypothetical protein
MTLVDRRTKRVVQVGDSLIRKSHIGFKTRYEILEIDEDRVFVRKLSSDDRWVYLHMPFKALQLQQINGVQP